MTESERLRGELEGARTDVQNMKDKLKTVEEEAWRAKLLGSEGDALLAQRDEEVAGMKETIAGLVTELRKRQEFAERIRDDWMVVKTTVDTFQCRDVAPRGFSSRLSSCYSVPCLQLIVAARRRNEGADCCVDLQWTWRLSWVLPPMTASWEKERARTARSMSRRTTAKRYQREFPSRVVVSESLFSELQPMRDLDYSSDAEG